MTLLETTCWIVVLLAGTAAGVVWCYATKVRRLTVWDEPPRDAVILAAHQDDCVIAAGEYAVAAAAAGRRIDVVYLTCGDETPGSKRARTRRAEALSAWESLGVGPDHLYFLDLPESDIHGPPSASPRQLAEARARIEMVLRNSAVDSAVFIPAAGESHVDHQVLRQLALAAWRNVGGARMICEAPEYNPYYSLLYAPRKTLLYVGRAIPLLRRLLPSTPGTVPPSLIDGRESILRPDPQRLARKIELLTHFVSEKPQLLIDHFGFPDRYRVISDPAHCRDQVECFYLPMGRRWISTSTMVLWLSVWGLVLMVGLVSGRGLGRLAGTSPAMVIVLAAGLAAIGAGLRRGRQVEERILWALVGFGWIIGATGAGAL